MESDLGSLRITSLEEDEEEDDEMDDFGKGEQEDDEDDEEDEEEVDVTLGFVDKPKNPCLLLRHLFPSKAGGVPAWLDPMNLPSEKSFTCGFCRDPLQFLLQILYVFMCPSMSCLLRDQHEQWKHSEVNPYRSCLDQILSTRVCLLSVMTLTNQQLLETLPGSGYQTALAFVNWLVV